MSPFSNSPEKTKPAAVWDLPPLILHPFNEHVPASALLDNSKAALMLSGLIPGDGSEAEELARRLLAGRYSEVRMLYFLGKDVFRWIEQSLEWAEHIAELRGTEIYQQSFAGLLTEKPPAAVSAKLLQWGVSDHLAIFRRAIGLNALFGSPPGFEILTAEFLRGYHRYADFLFRCFMDAQAYRQLDAGIFRFDLYASGEYSRMLETEWGKAEE